MSRSRALAVVLLAVLAGVLVVALPRVGGSPAPRPPVAVTDPAATGALRALHAWDARRADAWARGSPGRLRALYLPGSAAGRSDVRLLRAYLARGYRVAGLRTQVLAVRVTTRRERRLRLTVTDRLAAGVAVGHGHRRALPRDGPTTRVVTMVRAPHAAWRVAAVSPTFS